MKQFSGSYPLKRLREVGEEYRIGLSISMGKHLENMPDMQGNGEP
ncbi:hypothetical protein [Caldivirga maquilingensis]|nr:hypothetical protein [Caldivirga maquilingensis]